MIWMSMLIKTTNASLRLFFMTPIASPSVSQTGFDPTIIAALIGFAGGIVVALITGAFALYQIRRNAKHDRQRQEEQFRHEQEMLHLQKELEAQYKHKEQEEQHQDTEAETAHSAMQRAQSLAQRVAAYREALHADPRIARLQILDMNRPLAVMDIYIRLSLHRETKPGYDFDPLLQEAETSRDPNILLKSSHLRLEKRVSTSLAPEEALRTYKHCIIVGDPGAGKTTLLKYLTLQAVDQHLMDLLDLPIHIELNAFASSGHNDLLEFASFVWEERYGFPKAEALNYMQKQLHKGKAALLLDALDETVAGATKEQAEEAYLHVSKAITDVATRYHQASIVVTARKAGYHQRPRLVGFTELEVLDFRPDEIRQFVERWFACHPDPRKQGNASELNEKLERNSRMLSLAANPLLLSLIVIVYEDQLDLPERRAELYKQCVDTLLTKWDASRNIRRLRAFKPEHKRQLLEEVAWHFHRQGQRYFAERELLDVVAAFLPAVGLKSEQNRQVLDEITTENGLLKEQARSWYGFLHLTLQEYFTAQYAVDQLDLGTMLMRRNDPWWEEVLFLYAGRVPDASSLLEHLLGLAPSSSMQDDLFHTNLILAGCCLAAYPTVRQVFIREEVISRLFQLLKDSNYSPEQVRVAQTLVGIGGASVNGQLVQMLSDEQISGSVRWSIAKALGEWGEKSMAPQLVQLLASKQMDKYIFESIVEALGEWGEKSMAPQLVQLLASKQMEESVRWKVGNALGRLGEKAVVPQLMQLLIDKQLEEFTRQCSAMALGELGEKSIVPQLMELLADAQVKEFVRSSIADALGKLGEKSIVPQLMELLADAQVKESVRSNVAVALGELGGKSIVPRLMQLLADTQDEKSVRDSIAYAIGVLGEKSVAPQLVQLLADTQVEESVRDSIAYALEELAERSIVPQLMGMLTDQQLEEAVRIRIVYVLEKVGERSIVPQLMGMLTDQQLEESVRRSIVEALAGLGEKSVVPQLVQLLTDKQLEEAFRFRIAYAIGALGEKSVVPQLVQLLTDKQLEETYRRIIASDLTFLAYNEEHIHLLATCFLTSDIADTIYRVLWELSRKVGVRIFAADGVEGKRLEVVKLSS